MNKHTGGPAFPVERRAPQLSTDFDGMTLRQYYMAHAPITLNDARTVAYDVGALSPTGDQLIALLVDMRAAYADAMIAENAK